MSLFYCKCINESGSIIENNFHATSRDQLLLLLQRQKLIPLRIRQSWFTRNKIKPIWIYRFSYQLALLLEAKIPLDQALSILTEVENNPSAQKIIQDLQKQIQAGLNLSSAMQIFPQYFSDQYRAFIQAGEATAQLGFVLFKLAAHIENRLEIKTQIKKTVSYPIFLVSMLICMLLAMGIFILPQYQDFFNELGARLPPLTIFILTISHWLQKNSGVFLLGNIVLLSSLRIMIKSKKGKQITDRLVIQLPIIKQFVKTAALSNWSNIMMLACQTYIPLLQAFSIANNAVSNFYLQENLRLSYAELALGKSLHESLKQTQLFSPVFLQLILIGENGGRLADMLEKIAIQTEKHLKERFLQLIKLSGPLIMVSLAIIIGVVITGLYLPMLNLGLNSYN